MINKIRNTPHITDALQNSVNKFIAMELDKTLFDIQWLTMTVTKPIKFAIKKDIRK